jgi:hypothetical protein
VRETVSDVVKESTMEQRSKAGGGILSRLTGQQRGPYVQRESQQNTHPLAVLFSVSNSNPFFIHTSLIIVSVFSGMVAVNLIGSLWIIERERW